MTPQAEPTRVALVSGATSGIGQAVATRLADNGFTVVGVGLNAPKRNEETDRLRIVECDVRARGQVDAIVADVLSEHGRIDVLCNAAGIKLTGDILSLTDSDLDETFAVNVKGVLHLMQAVVPVMIGEGGGAIVNIGSPSALAEPASVAYSASKAAVTAITTSAALQLIAHGVRVNLVVPGSTRTGMNETRPESINRELGRLNVSGRINEPDDVAAAVAFLASDAAATISGAQLEVGTIAGLIPSPPAIESEQR